MEMRKWSIIEQLDGAIDTTINKLSKNAERKYKYLTAYVHLYEKKYERERQPTCIILEPVL